MNTHPNFSDSIIIETQDKPQACVIWLHGLGADGHDFVPIVEQFDLPKDLGVKFIFPHAPIRPVSLNDNVPMRAWFDVYSLENFDKHDHIGIESSEKGINHLIDQQLEYFPSNRIILAGFSQGGAMALFAGLRFPKKLAGIIALSTCFPYIEPALLNFSDANKNTPIFMAHGQFDPVLPLDIGEGARSHLATWKYPIEWHEYPMAHEVCDQEIKDISGFITQILMQCV